MKLKNVDDVYPLSPMQQGILFHCVVSPRAGAYVEQLEWSVDGPLDAAAFENAWRLVVARHPILRSVFLWQRLERPLQVVRREVAWGPARHDWRQLGEEDRRRRFRELSEADRRRGFDLASAPLMRLTAVRWHERRHRFLWTYHHLLLDGWSVSIVLGEVFHCYRALAEGREPELPASRPYREYIAWLGRQDVARAEAFWRLRLAGFGAPTPFGVDRRRAAGPSAPEAAQERRVVRLGRAPTAALGAAARSRQVSPSTLLSAAWGLSLARYAGAADVVFGCVVAGRPAALEGIEETVGVFVDTLPVRLEVRRKERVSGFLSQVRERMSELQEVAPVSLATIREWSDVPAGLPLFESLVVYENVPVRTGKGDGRTAILDAERADSVTGYPFLLAAFPGDDMVLHLCYHGERFDATTVERLGGHLRALLGALSSPDERRLAELDLLGRGERHQLMVEWAAARPLPSPGSLHEAFRRAARRTPDAVAVSSGASHLGYGELLRRAEALAGRLRALGVEPEVRVGLCLERSNEQVTAILAILEAGGAYVPLDPADPVERLSFLVADAAISVLLTRGELLGRLPPFAGETLRLDLDPACDLPRGAEPRVPGGGDHLAYLIYTSGSTGRPKGVAVSHSSVLRLFAATREPLGLGRRDVWSFFHSFAFDFSVWEIWGALLHGGRLVVVPYWQSRSPARLWELLEAERVTVLSQTPTAFAQLARAASRSSRAAALRLVVFGGEALESHHLEPWIEGRGRDGSEPRLVNMYGITETTVHVTLRELSPGAAAGSIGRALTDLGTHLLDRRMEPVPLGAAGEIHVGGPGLARGYPRLPAHTAERFVPHPGSDQAGARLYKSGDLARHRPHGELEYLERADRQLKVRGFRIEPAEVESLLRAHPGVADAVVVAREVGPGDRRLTAWMVGVAEVPAASELRRWLSSRLAEPLVPAAYHFLEELPRTSGGKVDRGALARRRPEDGEHSGERRATPPRTPAERALAAIWRRLLGVEAIAAEDHFFAVGGDSILAMQVAAAAQLEGWQVSPRDLFEHPTLAELAAVARRNEVPAPSRRASTAEDGEVPLTPIQRWFFEHHGGHPHHYVQAVLLAVRRPAEPSRLERCLELLVNRHDALRLRFSRRSEGGWRQRVEPVAAPPSLLAVDLGRLSEPEAGAALEAAAGRLRSSLDVGSGPLLRAALFETGPGAELRLLLVAHHLGVDAVSWRLLLAELETAWRQLSRGRPIELPPAASFARWARRLAEHAARADQAGELDRWRSRSRGGEALPRDHMRGEDRWGSARGVSASLSADETRALVGEVAPSYRAGVHEVLLAALVEACARWTGGRALLVDLESHGREPVDGCDPAGTVGWLTCLHPVRLEAAAEGAARDATLKAVKEELRSIPHGGLAYGLTRYLGSPESARALAALPPAEVCFNYLGRFDQGPADACFSPVLSAAGGPSRSPAARRAHLLEIDGAIGADGRLEMVFTYSASRHRRETIDGLAAGFLASLRALADHCRRPGAGGFTPSDFPLAGLGQGALDEIFAALGTEAEDVYRLSPLQEGILFHTVRAPGSLDYREQWVFRLRGELDRRAFAGAWREVVDRHPALRTGFLWREVEEPVQVVRRRAALSIAEEDWRHLPAGERERRLESFLAADRRRGFELSEPPLMRLSLIRTAEREHRVVWSHHHLVLDGWSVALLLDEALAGYRALRTGTRHRPPPARPYRDYLRWLEGRDMDATEAFWRRALAGFTAPTPLGSDPPPELAGEAREPPREAALRLDGAAFEAAARRRGLTLHTLVQGAWALLLGRLAGVDDVVFGTTFATRPAELSGAERMVGLLINTLPARIRWSAGDALQPWLEGLQKRHAELAQHGHSRLARVRSWSEVPPASPLFESLLVFESYPWHAADSRRAAGLEVDELSAVEQAGYPLALVVIPGPELTLKLSYDGRRWGAAAAHRTLAQLFELLSVMAADGTRSLGELRFPTLPERHQLIREWNDTRVARPAEILAHQACEVPARRTPDRVAAVRGEAGLSYGRLAALAGRLAGRLRALGAGPEARLGLVAGRGLGSVVGVLGILESGAACVPLDPAQPPRRLARLLAAARVSLAVAEEHWRDRLPAELAVVGLESILSRTAIDPEALAARGGACRSAHGENAACVYFTSGSTGRPKGVELPHRAIANRLAWAQASQPLSEDDRCLQVAALTFDISLWEILGPLTAGARLEIAEPTALSGSGALLAALTERRITSLHLVPSLLEALLEEPLGRTGALARVFCGGERLAPRLIRAFYARSAARLFHFYGPTEAAISVTSWEAPRGPALPGDVRLGRPIAASRVHLLDRRLRPMPISAPGELHIAGACLARGYLERPGRTASAFLPDPFAERPGGRLYRTGDRARRLPGGELVFLGRLDDQVKIRGVRVEPGEIEAAVAEHPRVREAAVVAVEVASGTPRLAACFVAAPGARLSPADLRSFLAARLPEVMLPQMLRPVDEIPRGPHGKLDRAALAELVAGRAEERTLTAPRTAIEAALAEVWQEVLRGGAGGAPIGVHDSFFELGGDSISSLRVVARALRRGLELTPQDLFSHDTIARLADVVTVKDDQDREEPAGPPARAADRGPEAGALAASDFPDAGLSQRELDRFLKRLNQARDQD